MKNVFFVMAQTQQMALVPLLDRHVALHGQIDQRRGDVAHWRFVVDPCAALAGCELIGRLVLHGDGLALGSASARPPQPEHDEENDNGNQQRYVAAKELNESGSAARRVDESLVEANPGGKPFVK